MARKILLFLLFMLCAALMACRDAQAVSIYTEDTTDLGILIAGQPLAITIHADGYAGASSKVSWRMQNEGSFNPNLRLSKTKGAAVALKAASLRKPGTADGNFSITVTAKDGVDKSQESITFTGRVMELPAFKTARLNDAKAGSGKLYNSKIELKAGTEPVTWTISADIPGITFTEETNSLGKTYYLVSGDPEKPGNFPVEVHVENEAGSEDKTFTLKVSAVKPKITLPSWFEKKYTVKVSTDISIDVSGLEISGTKPISIDIDDKSKAAGLYYDSADKMIKGKITESPAGERLNVKLQVINPATETYKGTHKPVELALTVNVKSIPGRIIVPALFRQYNAHYDSYGGDDDVYATIGRSLNTSFKTEGGSKPITWDFIVSDRYLIYGRDICGKSIIKDLDGKFMGLTFSSNGTVRGVVDPSYNNDYDIELHFNVVAYNEVGSQDVTDSWNDDLNTDAYETFNIYAGLPPAFDKSKTAKAIPILNGSEVNISLDQYLDWDAMTRWKGAPIYSLTSEDILKYEYGRRWVSPITGETHIDYPYTDVRPSFSTASQLPNGLKVVSRHYILGVSHDKGASITGTVNVSSSSGLKKYPISLTIRNAYGVTRGTITLDIQDMPEIDPDGTITDSALTATTGKSYKLKFPTATKKPYVWTLMYEDEAVLSSGKIGDSGLTWNSSTATITGTNRSMNAGEYDIKILLSNDVGIAEKEYTITINDPENSSRPGRRTSQPETKSRGTEPQITAEPRETESAIETETPENESPYENASSDKQPEIITVNERGISSLSARILSAVSNDEYIVAAVLPEILCSESGTYDISAVLYENVPAGASLVWFAFPKDDKPSDDEDVAMFLDDAGKEITEVPENRKITVSVWLNKGRIYEPVIAVKRK